MRGGWTGSLTTLVACFSAVEKEFAFRKLETQTLCHSDEYHAANTLHSPCRGFNDGRIEAENRDAF